MLHMTFWRKRRWQWKDKRTNSGIKLNFKAWKHFLKEAEAREEDKPWYRGQSGPWGRSAGRVSQLQGENGGRGRIGGGQKVFHTKMAAGGNIWISYPNISPSCQFRDYKQTRPRKNVYLKLINTANTNKDQQTLRWTLLCDHLIWINCILCHVHHYLLLFIIICNGSLLFVIVHHLKEDVARIGS